MPEIECMNITYDVKNIILQMLHLSPTPLQQGKQGKDVFLDAEGRYSSSSKSYSDLRVQCIFNIIQKTSEYNFVTLKSNVLTGCECHTLTLEL